MIFYRPTDGDVHVAPLQWRPRTCFLMAPMTEPLPEEVVATKRRVTAALRRAGFGIVDAASATTGKDYLLKIWFLAVSCRVGVAIVHEGIRPETMANIFYELGLMQAYGRETVVIRVGNVKLPSDLVRTECIALNRDFTRRFKAFVRSLEDRAGYYLVLADQLEKNPLLAIDYLRRTYLLTGKAALRRLAKQIFENAGLGSRSRDSVERLLASF